MKRIFASITLILSALLLTAGCAVQTQESDKLQIVATIFPPYDFTRQIAADKADITLLIRPGTDMHTYEPTVQDMEAVQNADLFIYNGGESDKWAEQLLQSVSNEPAVLAMTDCTQMLQEEHLEGSEEHDHEIHGQPEYDEHVWTSPMNAIKIAEAIRDELCSLDEANADFYTRNAEEYVVQLRELDDLFRSVTENAQRRTVVFADKFPFRYLAEEYGLECYAAFPGCSEQSEPSVATVASIIDKVKADGIPAVFYIEMSNQKMADSVCQATGAAKLQLHSCHTLTAEEFRSGQTYISIMTQNAENLRIALN